MECQRILITGGAGFIGGHLARSLKRDFPDRHVIAFDNLMRFGSQWNVPLLQQAGIEFLQGDVRNPADFERAGPFDLLIDCAAEPSVQAGLEAGPREVFAVNLQGTINALEAARVRQAAFLFLSTSRVYPISDLNEIPFVEHDTRYSWERVDSTGVSAKGISETFPLGHGRSYYGVSKLASELIAAEYAAMTQLPVLINRCGLVAGPGQFGKVDQGVIALWVLHHYFGKPLRYIGFGGTGKQVRDVLHVEDLYQLIKRQLQQFSKWNGSTYNVGGGRERAVSLCELTEICQKATGQRVPIHSVAATSPVDLRIFITDATHAQQTFNWQPQRQLTEMVTEIADWIGANESTLRALLERDA